MTGPAEASRGLSLATVLDNGLRVLILEEHTAALVSVWCWYRVGSGDEPPGLTGVSHWVEHMNFKGTANIPCADMKGLVEQAGGTWNGYTWLDQTTYFETAGSDALDRLLFIEAERMGRCLYDAGDCESERTVILSELAGHENDPQHFLEQELVATALKVHPYRQPTIGWRDDLCSMTRDDLYAHYRRYYVPNNATLVIVGDVVPDVALERVRHHFAAYEPGAAVGRARTREPEQSGERRMVIRQEGTASHLKVAWHAPAFGDEAFAPALVLDAVLTGAKGVNIWSVYRVPPPQRRARLYQAIVESGAASSVDGALWPTADPYLYTVSTTANAGTSLDALENALLGALEQVARDGVTSEELARAKAQLYARLVFDGDGITDVAHQLGYFATIASVDAFLDLPDRIAATSHDAVNAAAATLFASRNRTVARFDAQSGMGPSAASGSRA
jgi:zinc protease